MRQLGSLPVIQPAGEQAREEEGAQRDVEDEKVVEHAEVLQPEKLRGGRDGDGDVDAVADADDDGAQVERSGGRFGEQDVAEEEKHLSDGHPYWSRNGCFPVQHTTTDTDD